MMVETDPFEKLTQKVKASLEKKKIRRERPWAYDIIRVLWPCKIELHIDPLVREVWELRNGTLLPMPKEFRNTVQSTLNHHTSQSEVFRKNVALPMTTYSIRLAERGQAIGLFIVIGRSRG